MNKRKRQLKNKPFRVTRTCDERILGLLDILERMVSDYTISRETTLKAIAYTRTLVGNQNVRNTPTPSAI